MDTHELDARRAECAAFPDRFRSLLLATASKAGEPNASYAPYLRDGTDFIIYVSELAAHTHNLRDTGKASVFFIENEDQADNLFARRRLTFRCSASIVPRGTEAFARLIAALEARFGSTMRQLKDMTDFHLVRLTPHKATYVAGFARAFSLEGEALDTLRHINDSGHRREAAR